MTPHRKPVISFTDTTLTHHNTCGNSTKELLTRSFCRSPCPSACNTRLENSPSWGGLIISTCSDSVEVGCLEIDWQAWSICVAVYKSVRCLPLGLWWWMVGGQLFWLFQITKSPAWWCNHIQHGIFVGVSASEFPQRAYYLKHVFLIITAVASMYPASSISLPQVPPSPSFTNPFTRSRSRNQRCLKQRRQSEDSTS